jgi:hypothetical protein
MQLRATAARKTANTMQLCLHCSLPATCTLSECSSYHNTVRSCRQHVFSRSSVDKHDVFDIVTALKRGLAISIATLHKRTFAEQHDSTVLTLLGVLAQAFNGVISVRMVSLQAYAAIHTVHTVPHTAADRMTCSTI